MTDTNHKPNETPSNPADSALLKGVDLVAARIKNYSHRYTDDPGAHFILLLQEQSGNHGVLDFFQRLETEGFNMKLNTEEEKLLETVRQKSSPKALLSQVSLTAGAQAALTRRQALRKLGAGAALVALQAVSSTLNGTSNRVKELGNEQNEIEEQLGNPKLSDDERAALQKRKEELLKELEQSPLVPIVETIARYPIATVGFMVMLSQIAALGMDVHRHANEKKDKIINITSDFTNYRLGYNPTRPPEPSARI